MGSPNKESLGITGTALVIFNPVGELLAGFFREYSMEFDWTNSVISVRTARYLTKKEKGWTLQQQSENRDQFLLAIEGTFLLSTSYLIQTIDPFETTHNLGRLVDKPNLEIIQYEFARAYKLICANADLATVCKHYRKDEPPV
jgi:DNA polymerase sigma